MKLSLWYNLKRAKNDLKPRSGFKRELGSILSKEFDRVYGKQNIWYQYLWVRTTRVIIASSLGVSMVGTSVYAYSSPQITDGNILYPIKISLEKIEEQTKISPEAKVKFLLKKADRREAEREVIVDKVGSEIKLTFSPVETVATSSYSFATATEDNLLNSVVITTLPREVEVVDKKLEDVDHNLENLESKLGESSEAKKLKEKIQERLSRHKSTDTDDNLEVKINNSGVVTSTLSILSFPTSTVVEFDREDKKESEQKSYFRKSKIVKKFIKDKEPEKIKIIQNEKGEIRVVDNNNDYRIYSSSTPARIEKMINGSTTIRLEIKSHDQETKWYRSETSQKTRTNELIQKTSETEKKRTESENSRQEKEREQSKERNEERD